MKKLANIFLFLFLTNITFGQERECLTDELHHKDSAYIVNAREQAIKRHISSPQLRSNVTYVIPVVFHIVHNNALGIIGGVRNTNITDTQVYSQLQALNEDFRRQNADTVNTPDIFKSVSADVNIEFCLASYDPNGNTTTGITRHYSNELPFNSRNSLENKKLKEYGYWPADQYLNVWVTDLFGTIGGYATYPTDINLSGLEGYTTPLFNDGVVADYLAFGKETGMVISGNYNLGRTVTHEVGHWLGLIHTWGNSNDCIATDYCNDTPSQFEASTGCPTDQSSCTARDMFENYMDYSYDACLNIFTQDQKSRMRAVMELSPRRAALLSSQGCCIADNSATLPLIETFDTPSDVLVTYPNWTISNETLLSVSPNDSLYVETPYLNLASLNVPTLELQLLGQGDFQVYYQLPCSPSWEPLDASQAVNGYHEISLASLKAFSSIKLKVEFNTSSSIAVDQFVVFDNNNQVNAYMYPNPTTGILNIQFSHNGQRNKTVKLYNVLGNQVSTIDLPENYASEEQISYDGLVGVYIIEVTIDSTVVTEKITFIK
ncbi:M43 family zinc metalloprotease [Cyclobacteriaceae bacterium]|nr:M43 family zinc metalloprotease [Cyclobacteriaceae bacterium]